MQLLPSLTKDPKVRAREAPAGAHLPYARHIDDVTIETRDGLLMQTIRLRGLLFETADSDELNYRTGLRDAILRTIGSSRFAVYHHVVRRKAEAGLTRIEADEFSASLDTKWHDKLGAKQLYVNELFLTIIRRPLQGRIGIAERLKNLFANSGQRHTHHLASEKHALDRAREALMASLGAYDPHLLTVYESEHGKRSEYLEFLSYLYNADMHPVSLPKGDLGHFIPSRRISFGQDAIELAPNGDLPRQFAAVISIKDYPGTTFPGMFDELYRLPFELHVSQSFALVERQKALGQMNLALRRMQSAEDEAISLRDELSVAKDEVAAGRAGFGEHHTSIAVHAESLEALNDHVAEVIAVLADLGINAVREDIALEPTYWAQFPANFKYIGRRGLVSTTNFAGLASLHNFAIGGQYDRMSPEVPSGLNPLQLEDTPTNRQFLYEWLSLLAGDVSATEQDLIRDAVETNFEQPKAKRRLRHLVELFRGGEKPRPKDLYSRLRPWWGEGENAWLFDNPKDLTDLSAETVGFDMSAILDDPSCRTPAMFYFFHRVEERLDGSPSIIVIDEGWKALDDPIFVRRIKDWEKTIRKRNGIVGFATQSASDALESQIASAIIEQAATQIFMINPKAKAEDYINGFGLSAHEFELVRSMPDSSHCFLIRHGRESVVARLDLSGEQELLTILSGRESTVRLFDELVGKTGTDPANWLHLLLERAA